LGFSVPRNLTILFYDTDKSTKIDYLRVIKVIGFLWVSFDYTVWAALKSYPLNYNDYPDFTTTPIGVAMISGMIYGYSMLYFYMGF